MSFEKLPSDLSETIHLLSAWWTAPAVPRRQIRSLVWGGQDLSAHADNILPDVDDLHLMLSFRGNDARPRGHVPLSEFWNKPISGEAEDGWRFRARSAGAVSFATALDETAQLRITVKGWDWRLDAPSTKLDAPKTWVAELTWEFPAYMGNLLLEAQHSWSRGHYFLRGPESDYILIERRRENWLLVVHERAPEAATHVSLRRDMKALAMAFGAPLQLSRLYAVDRELRVVAVLGGSFAKRLRRSSPEQAPVPSTNDVAALPVVFFECLASHFASVQPEAAAHLQLATWYYLESLEEYSADASLVKMVLAVIAASRYLLRNDLALTRDAMEYSRWLSENAVAVAGLERPGRSGFLQRELASALCAGPESIIHLGMQLAGLTRLPDLDDALKFAIASLSGDTTPRGRLYDFLPRLRTVAAALVARAVGYNGRLAGWSRHADYSFYEPPPSGWWNDDAEISAAQYSASIEEMPPDIASMWPDIVLPEVPTTGPIALLVRHASALSSKTDGRVYADVQPLPRNPDDDARRYEFALRVTRQASTKTVLFILRDRGDFVEVEGWSDEITLHTAPEVLAFVRSVADSAETRAALERLLLAAREAERNAAV